MDLGNIVLSEISQSQMFKGCVILPTGGAQSNQTHSDRNGMQSFQRFQALVWNEGALKITMIAAQQCKLYKVIEPDT